MAPDLHPNRILVIRRDNIGDLVCTTPLIAALRQRYPNAEIAALVNSYNAEVLEGNPDIDRLFVYKKLKHAGSLLGRIKAILERAKLVLALRHWQPEVTILAKTGYDRHGLRFARQIKARLVVGLAGDTGQDQPEVMPYPKDTGHEVERLMALLAPLGVVEVPGALKLVANPTRLAQAAQVIKARSNKPVLGVNLSARLPSQQWSVDNFANTVTKLEPYFRIVLFWSPGSEHNAMHPGDDEKAAAVAEKTKGADLLCYPTRTLADLIAGTSSVDYFLTADGGAMHIAAACHKPTVALFGSANPEQWYPWGVPYTLLRDKSQDVSNIAVDDVVEAVQKLPRSINISLVQ